MAAMIQSLRPVGLDQNALQSVLDLCQASATTIGSLSNNIIVANSAALAPIVEPAVGAFECFPKFPPELRRMIWKLALPGPRVIEVVAHCVLRGPEKTKTKTLAVNVDMPALMHVCRESRQVSLEKYSVKLANNKKYPNNYARFDPSEDIIYIPDLYNMGMPKLKRFSPVGLFSTKALDTLQSLVISVEDYFSTEGMNGWNIDFTPFKALKIISVIPDFERHCEFCGEAPRAPELDISLDHDGTDDVIPGEIEGKPDDDSKTKAYDEDGPLWDMRENIRTYRDTHNRPEWKIPTIRDIELNMRVRKPTVKRKYWGY